MTIKERIITLIPGRLELAARYTYNRMLGRLERELGIIEAIVPRRRRCLDIGANVGLYTYRLARLFRDVESFEPIPRCRQIIASSKLRNVHLHTVALSNRAGQAHLHIPVTGGPEATALASLSNHFPGAESLLVELRTLDSYGFVEVDLIKIDVEGHEFEVLEGGRETIARERPTLLVEVEQRHHCNQSIQSIINCILHLGYSCSFYWNGHMHPLDEFSVEKHQQPINLLNRTEYVNNFIFRPVEG